MNTLKHIGHDGAIVAALLAAGVLIYLFAQLLATGIVYLGMLLF